MPNRDVFILAAVRTPIGVFDDLAPLDWTFPVLHSAVSRAGLPSERLDAVLWSAPGLPGDLPRRAMRQAGFTSQTPAVVFGGLDGGGQQALHFGAQAILAEDMDLVLVGGTGCAACTDQQPEERLFSHDWAAKSQHRAAAAHASGVLDAQIVPLRGKEGRTYHADQRHNGQGATAPPADGAAALLLASPDAIGRYNLMPSARVVTRSIAAAASNKIAEGLITVTQHILKQTSLPLEALDVVEINEDSSALVSAWRAAYPFPAEQVNPLGGALACGNPLGAAGAVTIVRLLAGLAHRSGQYGLALTGTASGVALATLIERI